MQGSLALLLCAFLAHFTFWRQVVAERAQATMSARLVTRMLSGMKVYTYGGGGQRRGADCSPATRRRADKGGGSTLRAAEVCLLRRGVRPDAPEDGGGVGLGSSSGGSSNDGGRVGGGDGGHDGGRAGPSFPLATECAICLEPYACVDEVVLLPCGHMLHKACLVSWARTKAAETRCPLCKAALVQPGADEDEACRCCCCPRTLRVGAGSVAMV